MYLLRKDLYSKALAVGLNANVVKDAGRTQIAPGSITVLAVGPGLTDTYCQMFVCGV